MMPNEPIITNNLLVIIVKYSFGQFWYSITVYQIQLWWYLEISTLSVSLIYMAHDSVQLQFKPLLWFSFLWQDEFNCLKQIAMAVAACPWLRTKKETLKVLHVVCPKRFWPDIKRCTRSGLLDTDSSRYRWTHSLQTALTKIFFICSCLWRRLLWQDKKKKKRIGKKICMIAFVNFQLKLKHMFSTYTMLFFSLMRWITKTLHPSSPGSTLLWNLRTLCGPRVKMFAHPCHRPWCHSCQLSCNKCETHTFACQMHVSHTHVKHTLFAPLLCWSFMYGLSRGRILGGLGSDSPRRQETVVNPGQNNVNLIDMTLYH